MARRGILFSILMISLAACTAQGERYEKAAARADTGTIYVYRPLGKWNGRGENPYVNVAGKLLGRLFAGGYVAYAVPAGEHRVEVVQSLLFLPVWPKGLEVAVAEGSSTYVKVDQRITSIGGEDGGGVTARQEVFIEEVDEVTGQAALAKSRLNE